MERWKTHFVTGTKAFAHLSSQPSSLLQRDRHTLLHALNIGIDWWLIPTELRRLLDDVKAWIQYGSYPPNEIAVRFHHRLVVIHPFPNGNGRHGRLIADLLVMRLGGQRFTWGSAGLREAGDPRQRYIAALYAADAHDLRPLVEFARS